MWRRWGDGVLSVWWRWREAVGIGRWESVVRRGRDWFQVGAGGGWAQAGAVWPQVPAFYAITCN